MVAEVTALPQLLVTGDGDHAMIHLRAQSTPPHLGVLEVDRAGFRGVPVDLALGGQALMLLAGDGEGAGVEELLDGNVDLAKRNARRFPMNSGSGMVCCKSVGMG